MDVNWQTRRESSVEEDRLRVPLWNSPQQRVSWDLEREYTNTAHSYTNSRFGYSCYDKSSDLAKSRSSAPIADKVPSDTKLPSTAYSPVVERSHSEYAPAVDHTLSNYLSKQHRVSVSAHVPLEDRDPSPEYLSKRDSSLFENSPSESRVPLTDYISLEERERLCREDMTSICLRPNASWYPTTPALFHNLHPDNTVNVRLTSAQEQGGFQRNGTPRQVEFQRCGTPRQNLTSRPSSAPIRRPVTPRLEAAGRSTSDRRADDWGTNAVDPLSMRTIPVKQFYDLTQLKRSNLRTNDELTPHPTKTDMGPAMIERPFPSEHPYSSHEPRLAIFPKFTENPDDPRTGVKARERQPLHSEVPSKPFDILIKAKTKGHGLHHDLQALPADSEREALSWPGDRFEQLVKGEGRPKQNFYPIPPKMVKPNMELRIPERTISETTADTLRNLERDQWRTHYSREHTGLGAGNPPILENYGEKRLQLIQNGAMNDDLRPHSTRTFDPPRPVEGRISRQIVPRAPPQPPPAPNPNRKPTVTEVEDARLRHGKQYASFPERAFDQMVQDQQWRVMEKAMAPENGLERLQAVRMSAPAQLMPEESRDVPDSAADVRQQTFKDMVQQMEVQDRWKELEQETAADDVSQLRQKYQNLGHGAKKDTPRVFFDHEGRFQEERAGLYKTSYEPSLLRHAMPGGHGENGAGLFDTSQSHEAAWSHPSSLNRAVSLPNIGGQGNDLMLHQMQKVQQRSKLEPTVESSSVRTQEGGHLVNRESEHGSQFNIDKFLQEYELPRYARIDPSTQVVGKESGLDLGAVRPHCQRLLTPNGSRNVTFSNDVMVAHGYGNQPILLSSATLNDSDEGYQSGPAEEGSGSAPVRNRRRLLLPEEALLVSHQLASKASTFQGNGRQEVTTSYSTQFPAAFHIGYKDDPRFQWRPGQGTRPPQSKLLEMQHSFNRSELRRSFHGTFSEENPDLRENITLGKKHMFAGINAQTLRG